MKFLTLEIEDNKIETIPVDTIKKIYTKVDYKCDTPVFFVEILYIDYFVIDNIRMESGINSNIYSWHDSLKEAIISLKELTKKINNI